MEFAIFYDLQLLNMVKLMHTPKIRPKMLLISILWATRVQNFVAIARMTAEISGGGGGIRPPPPPPRYSIAKKAQPV